MVDATEIRTPIAPSSAGWPTERYPTSSIQQAPHFELEEVNPLPPILWHEEWHDVTRRMIGRRDNGAIGFPSMEDLSKMVSNSFSTARCWLIDMMHLVSGPLTKGSSSRDECRVDECLDETGIGREKEEGQRVREFAEAFLRTTERQRCLWQLPERSRGERGVFEIGGGGLFAIVGRVEYRIEKTTLSILNRDSNLDLPVINSLVRHKCSALDHAATEVVVLVFSSLLVGYITFLRSLLVPPYISQRSWITRRLKSSSYELNKLLSGVAIAQGGILLNIRQCFFQKILRRRLKNT
uniref:Histone H2A C-terminal domain-containing protein n=2 Tax=Timema TaxID=61471 RepID=A0A7R9ALN4_TIMSH|nr:unnamed protein product [Timema shepardi]CAD7568787.1 unnamed protein product [Timema californicum]